MNPRTCVGCRQRASAEELIRCVAAADRPGILLADPRRRLTGRGAHLHPTEVCLEAAKRRRAFPRALRVKGNLDLADLETYVTRAGHLDVHNP